MSNSSFKKNISIIIICSLILSLNFGLDIIIFPNLLEQRGISNSLIGLSETIAFSAVFIISPIMPWLVRKFTMARLLLYIIILRAITLYLMPLTSSYFEWIFLNFLLGVSGSIYFISMQTWLSKITPDNKKGIMIGIFTVTFASGIAIAPFILKFIGIEGVFPFIFCAILILCSLPFVYFNRMKMPLFEEKNINNPFKIIIKSPIPSIANFVGDFCFFSLITFLYLYGIYNGIEKEKATFLLSAFMLGSISLDIFIGHISDKLGRIKTIIYCIIFSSICALCLPFLINKEYLIWILLFTWCGILGGIYISALAYLTTKYKGKDLVAANSAFSIMGSIGGMSGAFLSGVAMDIWQPNGLVYSIIFVCVLYLIFLYFVKDIKTNY